MDKSEALVQRVQAGDVTAFEVIYDAHCAMVYRIALRIGQDRMIAEDIAQEVFVKFWRDPFVFRGGNFASWLAQVTRNRTISFLRSYRARDEDEIPPGLRVESSVEEGVFARLDAARVQKALRELREEERSLIELSFFAGVTHERIAAATGIPLGTIKWRIRSGLRKMRESLREYILT
jgi:RNA polymerase sigma-70 factor (ECF subfamily)